MEQMISSGMRCAKAHIRLPIVIPLVAQGPTEPGNPYGDLIKLGQTMLDEDVLNVTILSGFGAELFSDLRFSAFVFPPSSSIQRGGGYHM